MIETIDDFENQLQTLDPCAGDFVLLVDKLIEELSPGIADRAYPAVLRFFEKHPEADCGAPGTLVHHLEDFYPNYVEALCESVQRVPSYNGVLMINRILNSEIGASERKQYMAILGEVVQRGSAPKTVVEMAMRFIKRQEEIQGEPPGSADVQSPTPTGRLHRHEKAYEGQSENTKTSLFENFPGWMVVVCNAVGLAVYTIGLYLMIRLGVVWGVLYAVYCLWVEGRVLSRSCRFCYYFGKRCAFGKGKVSSWFLTQGDSETFCTKQVSWRDVAPDFLVSLIPLGVGIFLLVRGFSWLVLLLIVALVGLGSVGTGLVRGNLACKHCKQRELGCPAQKLFSKTEHD